MLDFAALKTLLTHRKLVLVITATLALAAGIALIISLPYVYTSSATILIEREGLFGAEGSGQVGDNVNQRLHGIRTSVLSSGQVLTTLNTFKLLPANATEEEQQAAIEEFAEDASIRFDNVPVVNPYTGKTGMYSQGLIIEFTHTDPQTAHDITNHLTNQVINAHQGQDSKAVTHRRAFLDAEYTRALAKLNQSREALADFKNQNALYLPEVHAIAVRRYEDLQQQANRAAENAARLRRDLDNIRGELATASVDAFVLTSDGKRILGVDEQIRLLEADYAKAKSRYSTDHPERRALETELNSLRRYKQNAGSGALEAEIQQRQREIAALQQRYSPNHPDVTKLRREIAGLTQQLSERGPAKDTRTNNASNPEYNRMLIRQQSLTDEYNREQRRLKGFSEDLKNVESQLAQMPQVEQQMSALTQATELAKASFQEIESELENLKLEFGMRKANLMDHLSVIEEPKVPQKPSGPNKVLMMPIVVLFATLFSILLTFLIHLSRDHILSSTDIASIIDAPVYAVPKFG